MSVDAAIPKGPDPSVTPEPTAEQKEAQAAAKEEQVAQDEASATRVNQQCFLIDNWRKYAAIKAGGFGTNVTCIDGPPTDLTQRLTSRGGNEAFMAMSTGDFAHLVPLIRLFTIRLDSDGNQDMGEHAEKEIRFGTFINEATVDSITNEGARTNAVGIKEVSYEMRQGGNMATSGNRQKISIKFVAESLDALRRPHAITKTSPLDLVLRSRKFKSSTDKDGKAVPGSKQPNSEWFAVKIVYGWADPPADSNINPAVLSAIRNSRSTLTLTLTNHTLSFKEDGSVEVEGEYEGYADARLSELTRNILYAGGYGAAKSPASQRAEATKLEARNETSAAKAADSAAKAKEKQVNPGAKPTEDAPPTKTEKELETASKSQKEASLSAESRVQEDRQDRHQRIIKMLNASGKIWTIEVDPKALAPANRAYTRPPGAPPMSPTAQEKYDKVQATSGEAKVAEDKLPTPTKAEGSSKTLDKLNDATVKHTQGKVKEKSAESKEDKANAAKETKAVSSDFDKANVAAAPNGKVRISFMYWGDIFNTVLNAAYADKKLPVKYLVGPITFRDPRTGSTATVNIADIPISLPLFSSWWLSKIVGPGLDFYSIKGFVRDSVNELIIAALGDDCWAGGPKLGSVGGKGSTGQLEPPRLEFTVLSATTGQGGKDRLAGKPRISDFEQDVIKTPPAPIDAKPEKQVEYFYIYCNTWSRWSLTGNRQKDQNNGIYHLSVGQDVGPLKQIQFAKDDAVDLSTHAAMNHKGIEQLVASYKAEISMIGNTLFQPGNVIYVSPSALGVDTATAQSMGLGGYYDIINVNGKIDSSGWSTDLSCMPKNLHQRNRKPGQKINAMAESLPVDASQQGALPTPGGADPEKKQ
jgi:hypothetical protein